MANFGEGYRYHVTGLSHNEKGFPTEDSELVSEWWDHMHSKIDDNLDDILLFEEKELVDAEIAMIAYGGTAMAADHAVSIARQQGIKLGLLKLQTIWPFPEERVRKLLKDIGLLLRGRIEEHFAAADVPISVKYFDPSYSIRSTPANSVDSFYCTRLGAHAVHAAMAGKTGLIISFLHGRFVHVPIHMATAERNTVDPEGEKRPPMLSPGFFETARSRPDLRSSMCRHGHPSLYEV